MDNNFKSGNNRVPKARPVGTDIFSGTYDGKEMVNGRSLYDYNGRRESTLYLD